MKRILTITLILLSFASFGQSLATYQLITAAGTNTYTATLLPTPTYTTGLTFRVRFANDNTGASTINLNPLGAKDIKIGSAALTTGQIDDTKVYWLVYDGTQFQMSGGGGGTTYNFVTPLTESGGNVYLNTGGANDILAMDNSATNFEFKTIQSPLTVGTGVIGIQNAAADGSTKGAASFASADFNASSGNITLESDVARTTGNLSQFAATTSAQLRGVLSDELGTGAALFDGATPTSLVLTNATGLPYTGLTGTAPFWLTTGTASLTGAATIAGGANLLSFTAASLPSGNSTGYSFSSNHTGTASAGEEFTGFLYNLTVGGTIPGDDLWISKFQNSGTNIFRFTNAGQIWYGSSSGAGRIGIGSVTGGASASGPTMYFRSNAVWGSTNGNMAYRFDVRGVTSVNNVVGFQYGPASGEDSFTQTSGSASYTWELHNPSFNITSSATPTLIGKSFAPVETALTSGTTKYAYISSGTNWYHGFNTTTPTSTVDINGSLGVGYVAKTALYTLTDADHTVEVTSGTHTQTLPTAVGIAGRVYCVTNSGSGVVTLATTSSQTFVNITATPTTRTFIQFAGGCYQSNGANWIKLSEY